MRHRFACKGGLQIRPYRSVKAITTWLFVILSIHNPIVTRMTVSGLLIQQGRMLESNRPCHAFHRLWFKDGSIGAGAGYPFGFLSSISV